VKRPPSLVCAVEQTLRRCGVAGGLVVAVSGGPDSVALLLALWQVRGLGPLVAAHLNHLLRGEESDADEAFVRALCERLALVCRCERLDVLAAAGSEGGNLEGVARRLRYDWLARVAQDAGARWVATGHTADDQAETVLHRLLRGTGLKGLRGIAARRDLAPGVALVRPLLRATRADVIAYLNEIGQPYRQDSTNLDPAFTRNRLRHDLLPRIAAEYNPEIVACLGRLAEQAEEIFATEEEEVRSLLAAAELPRAGPLLVFDRRRLTVAPRQRVREVFRLLWEREGWPMGEMGFDAWERVASVALGEAASADLPGGVTIRHHGQVVQLGEKK
jgi:tRNA(Ile)-lysidine synthase